MIELFKKILYKIIWYGQVLWFDFLYCEWNPWALARLNMAWTNYTTSSVYKERMEIKGLLPKKFKEMLYENYAEQAYVENLEIKYYTKLFSVKDKLKIIFTPFSCGDKYKMPLYIITNWILGIKED